jgi:phosphocarrier protein HPr
MACNALNLGNPAALGYRTTELNGSRALSVSNPNGLHLRAAGEIVKVAHAFDADITLEYRDVKVSARSVLSIVLLSAGFGATVLATARGPEATRALDALEDLFATSMGERTWVYQPTEGCRDVSARGFVIATQLPRKE